VNKSKMTPHNVEAEEALLGSLLIDPEAISCVSASVQAGDFYIQKNGWIYEAILALCRQNMPVDLVTLCDELERRGRLGEVGGAAYITCLTNAVPSAIHAESYAHIVEEAAVRRRLIAAAGQIAQIAYRESDDVQGTLKQAEEAVRSVGKRVNGGRAKIPLLSADAILTTEWPEPIWAVPGLMPVGLTILAGKPKLGKSWLSLQIAQAVAAGGMVLGKRVDSGPVLYLALEDSPRRLKDRMRQQNWPTGLSSDFMVVGQFAEQIGDLQNGGGNRLAWLIEEREYRLIVVDTLSRAVYGDQNDVDRMTRALSPIQEMAHTHNCAVVMVDHHTKGFGANPDAVGDILGSTAKGGVSDCIWGPYRERGKAGAQLFVTGRDVEEQELVLTMDWATGCWQMAGEAGGFEMTERRREVLDALLEIGPSSLTEIAEAVDQPKSNTYVRLQDLSGAGYVQRDTDGGGKPVYCVVEDRL
jgi:replicative DNA helicase